MTSEPENRHVSRGRAKKARVNKNEAEPDRSLAPIDAGRAGGWMPPEDLREAALVASSASGDVAVNLQGIDHLDASALQVLLALDAAEKTRNHNLLLTNVSPLLRQWFDFAGVVDLHFPDRAEQQ